MRSSWIVILLFLPLAGRGAGDPSLRLPAGERREAAGAVTVSMGFGSVTFPEGAPGPLDAAPAAVQGRLKACNRGTFSLSYSLERSGGKVAARSVSVKVSNRARYIDQATPELRRHEEVHQAINRAQAERLEKDLSVFTMDTDDLKTAEKALRARFREGLKAVEALHKAWDANSVFVEPEKP
jgi:hypothetical protein